jgi:opacity protein-like surface antigen
MNRKFRMTLGVLVFSIAASLARAEDPRFGVQVHGNIPTGDLKDTVDSKLGLGGGAHVTFDLGDGHLIRPRLDYTFFPETSLNSGAASVKNKVNDLSVGADYLYFLNGKTEGLYLTGGLSFNHWKVDKTSVGESFSSTSNKPGFAAGVGFNLNPSFGGEIRLISSKFESGSKTLTANAIQAGVTLRF